MNGDVLEVLRQADPARDSGDYDHARVDRQVARILQADATPVPPALPRRSTARRVGVPVAAFVAIAAAGLGTAAAAGWLTPQARHAFDSPAARQSLLGLYGETADLDQARERVTVPGPDGATIATWTVPVADRGMCTAILVSKQSASMLDGAGQPTDLPTSCEETPAADQVQRSVRFTSLEWRSRSTSTDYLIYSGPLGQATGVRLQLASGSQLTAATGDGYFLLPAVPVANLHCAALIGLDPHGRQLGLASYLSTGCLDDPYQPGSAAKQRLGATIVDEAGPGQAVGYSDGIDVIVDTVIEQDPSRGVGSDVAGTSLVTVRLQFYQQLSHQTLPSSVSFDLLYGAQHQTALPDPGKHHDPDLNGVWNLPWPDPTAWLPQRTFDVPTDQLAQLQVRLNGDATHPTIIFGNVHVQGSR